MYVGLLTFFIYHGLGAWEGGKTVLATMKPTAMLALFHTPQLAAVAQEVEDTIVKIMHEAAE